MENDYRIKLYLLPHLMDKVSYIKKVLKQSKCTSKFIENIELPNYDELNIFRIRYDLIYSSTNEKLTEANLICHVEVRTNCHICESVTYKHLENFKYNIYSIREERKQKIKKLNLI